MRVLVLDADSRVALAIVRSLGRAGCDVTCADLRHVAMPLAFRSRYARRRVRLEALDAKSLAAAAEGHDVILGAARRSIDALAEHRAAIEATGSRVPLPPVERIRAANDKEFVRAAGRALGLATPETWDPESAGDLDRIAREIPFPAIVKLRRDEGADLAPRERYSVARNAGELRTAYEALSRLQPRPIVQRWIQGTGLGVGVLLEPGGDVLAQFAHVRERELPPGGGPSTACASAHEPAVEEGAVRLLRALGLSGVAMVEFRVDGRSGVPYLLEVNPRFWGSLELPIRCGVDFPVLLCRWAMGERFPAPAYRAGRRLRFFALDAAAALQSLRVPRLRRTYVTGFLRDTLGACPPDGIFRADDPSPGFQYVFSRLAQALSRCGSSR